ncbi:MAG TPA: prepilin-type N-terminal cleavage/methylation domain-containing protein [Candidatus Dojkabacteria bacterium]|nr:prepilin-type N-terminal cleavage/methylation domain-containing protein [Candidatus Dojkabacteria bacterium]
MKKTAFTLVELLVVMAIIGAMLAMGIYAMVQFRRTIQLQQATSQILGIIKETQNLAKNNTLEKNVVADANFDKYSFGYFLVFKDFNIYRALGQRLQGPGEVWRIRGSLPATGLKSDIFAEVQIKPVNCYAVVFINLTGDIIIQQTAANVPQDIDTSCRLQIQHTQEAAIYKVIDINIINDTYKIESVE